MNGAATLRKNEMKGHESHGDGRTYDWSVTGAVERIIPPCSLSKMLASRDSPSMRGGFVCTTTTRTMGSVALQHMLAPFCTRFSDNTDTDHSERAHGIHSVPCTQACTPRDTISNQPNKEGFCTRTGVRRKRKGKTDNDMYPFCVLNSCGP